VNAVRARNPLAGLVTFERTISSSGRVPAFDRGNPLLFELVTALSIGNRPANGLRARTAFTYSSQPASSSREL
jgi:hypothetical protein